MPGSQGPARGFGGRDVGWCVSGAPEPRTARPTRRWQPCPAGEHAGRDRTPGQCGRTRLVTDLLSPHWTVLCQHLWEGPGPVGETQSPWEGLVPEQPAEGVDTSSKRQSCEADRHTRGRLRGESPWLCLGGLVGSHGGWQRLGDPVERVQEDRGPEGSASLPTCHPSPCGPHASVLWVLPP